MTNNEKFNTLINLAANPHRTYNTLLALFSLFSREDIERAMKNKIERKVKNGN